MMSLAWAVVSEARYLGSWHRTYRFNARKNPGLRILIPVYPSAEAHFSCVIVRSKVCGDGKGLVSGQYRDILEACRHVVLVSQDPNWLWVQGLQSRIQK